MPQTINQLNHRFFFTSLRGRPRLSCLPSTFRLSTLGLFFTFNFSLLIFNCGLDIEDPTPPSAPVWVQKSLPEEWPERGIDAHETRSIFLEWAPGEDENSIVYLIYRAHYDEIADSMGDYQLIVSKSGDGVQEQSFVDTDVQWTKRYCYKLQAQDLAGNSSLFSDSLFYTLLPQIHQETMSPNGLSDTLLEGGTFSWMYHPAVDWEDYCITILDYERNFIFRRILLPGDYVNGWESWVLSQSIRLQNGRIYQWRIDTGSRYADGIESSASESPWATFLYAGE
jgi:hypothetical protein